MRVGEERRRCQAVIAGPPSRADLLGVRAETADDVVTGQRCKPARIARHREVERTPEEVHRRGAPMEMSAMFLHHDVDHRQHAVEACRLSQVVGGVGAVLWKRNRVRHL